MKRIFISLLTTSLLFSGAMTAFAQDLSAPSSPSYSDSSSSGSSTVASPTAQPPTGSSSLEGFQSNSWGSSFASVREHLKNLASAQDSPDMVKILYEDENKSILIERNGVRYVYRFYIPPEHIKPLKMKNKPGEHPELQYGRLFMVTIYLPMLPVDDVKNQLSQKYSNPTKPLIEDDGNGVFIWQLNGGMIFQWQEKFEGRHYTRRIDYLSVKIKEELSGDYKLNFTAKEKQILDKLKL